MRRSALVQLALALRRSQLLRVQRAIVDRLDLCRGLQHGIAPWHDLTPQKTIAIDGRRAVEQRRVRVPVLVELTPKLAVLSRIGLAEQRLELGIICPISTW